MARCQSGTPDKPGWVTCEGCQIGFISRGYIFIIPPDQTVAAKPGRSSDAANQHSITDIILPKMKSWANTKHSRFGTQWLVREMCSWPLYLIAVWRGTGCLQAVVAASCAHQWKSGNPSRQIHNQTNQNKKKKGAQGKESWHAHRASAKFSVHVVWSLACWSKYQIAGDSSKKFQSIDKKCVQKKFGMRTSVPSESCHCLVLGFPVLEMVCEMVEYLT